MRNLDEYCACKKCGNAIKYKRVCRHGRILCDNCKEEIDKEKADMYIKILRRKHVIG